MNDGHHETGQPAQSRARSFFGALGTGSLLNLGLIAWSVYQENWWIVAIAAVLGVVMLAMALTAVRQGGPTRREDP